jgi:hypothetical protein
LYMENLKDFTHTYTHTHTHTHMPVGNDKWINQDFKIQDWYIKPTVFLYNTDEQ